MSEWYEAAKTPPPLNTLIFLETKRDDGSIGKTVPITLMGNGIITIMTRDEAGHDFKQECCIMGKILRWRYADE